VLDVSHVDGTGSVSSLVEDFVLGYMLNPSIPLDKYFGLVEKMTELNKYFRIPAYVSNKCQGFVVKKMEDLNVLMKLYRELGGSEETVPVVVNRKIRVRPRRRISPIVVWRSIGGSLTRWGKVRVIVKGEMNIIHFTFFRNGWVSVSPIYRFEENVIDKLFTHIYSKMGMVL
jgi:hypothetical protein